MAQQKASGNYSNPYLFNGKELDEETGLYYYGARYYNPRYSVWLGVDPMVEKYAGVSPYNYTLNSPVIFVDPTGMNVDDHIFDADGKYLRTEKREGPDRIVIENSSIDRNYYLLNDPKHDSKVLRRLIKQYGSTETPIVKMKNKNDIDNYIDESGVNSEEAKDSPINYAYNNSREKGKMDYWSRYFALENINDGIDRKLVERDYGGFFIFEGYQKAYNSMDAGNFVWGAGMKTLGFSLRSSLGAADAHHFIFGRIRHSQGGLLDSAADKQAIINGHNYRPNK